MWQNKILYFNNENLDARGVSQDLDETLIFIENELDILGKDGWEPYNTTKGDNLWEIIFYLKRWLPEDE